MAAAGSIPEMVAEVEARLRKKEAELTGGAGEPLDLGRRGDESIADWLRRAERMLSAREAQLRSMERGGQTLPGDRVGAVPAGDRVVTGYSGGREPVTYGRGSLWIVVGILVILFLAFFGSLFLFYGLGP